MASTLDYGRVEIFEEETLGVGSYGKVCRAKYGQLPCAAKLLHQTMFQFGDPGVNKFTERFLQEGQFLSSIKHPNIVQYLATVQDPKSGRPVLLMELMEESLTKFLERQACPPPYHTQLNICYDVVLALSYLHTNHIIHRDLSSNNVLLMGAGRRAKVTDFGMSRLMDMNPRMTPLTQCPGMAACMPPETLTDSPHYSDKMDCFSWGVLAIQVMTGIFPNPTDARSFFEDSRFPTGRVIVLVPELERRKKDIDLIEADHPLRPEALNCLRDKDIERPSADELCEKLVVLMGEERYREGVQQERNQPSQFLRMEQELKANEREIESCHRQLEEKDQAIETKDSENRAYCVQLKQKDQVIETKDDEIRAYCAQLKQKDQVIETKDSEIRAYCAQLKQKDQVIETKDGEIRAYCGQLEQKDRMIEAKEKENEDVHAEMKRLQDMMNQELARAESRIQSYCRKYEQLAVGHKLERKERQRQIKDQLESMLDRNRAAIQKMKEDHQLLEKLVVDEKLLLDQKAKEEDTWQAEARQELKTLRARVPDYKTQKTEIHAALQQCLTKGNTWYLVDVRWMKKWKKYVGYDLGDQRLSGQETANPGPLDNSKLFKDIHNGTLKEHLREKTNYYLLPESAWHKLRAWYGISGGSRPIPRKVVEHGLMKQCKVEVYLLELKLCLYSNQDAIVVKQFSEADTVALLESNMRRTFSIAVAEECRLWHLYMANISYKLLDNSSQTLEDAELYSGQVKNKGGSWPWETQQVERASLVVQERALLDQSIDKKKTQQAKVGEELDTLRARGPDYNTQKKEIHAALQQRLTKGSTWYLVDVRWIKKWKKYVGYDQWDQSLAGQESANPGPVDNSNLFKDIRIGRLKEHLMEELDYYLLPESAWYKLRAWYGITDGFQPIQRKVVEHGLYMKHCKVEVYLLELKLCLHSNQEEIVVKQFSRADTIAHLESEVRRTFSIAADEECRAWHRYMTNTYELLSNSSQTLEDAELYNGQSVVLEVRNKDGTWPKNTQLTPDSPGQ